MPNIECIAFRDAIDAMRIIEGVNHSEFRPSRCT